MNSELQTKIEDIVMAVYIERAHNIMNQKMKNFDEVTEFVKSTLAVENLRQLQIFLKELVDKKADFQGGKYIYIDVLYQNVTFLIMTMLGFVDFLTEHDFFANSNKYSNIKRFFELYLLGLSNEVIDQNVKGVINYIHKDIAKRDIIKVNNFAERAYFSNDVQEKIKLMLKTSAVQLNAFNKIDNYLVKSKKKNQKENNDIFEYDWNDDEYNDFYLKTILYKEKVNILIGLISRISYIY